MKWVAVCLFVCTALTTARSAPDDHWDDQFGAAGVDGQLVTVCANGSDVYFGGMFSTAGSVKGAGIAKWDGTNWINLGSGISGPIPIVYSIAPQGSNIYVGGYFTNISGVAATNLACWNGSTWSQVGGGVSSFVISILPVGNKLYVGGSFTRAGSVFATNVACWDGTNWSALGNGVSVATNGQVLVGTLVTNDTGHLIAGGNFQIAGTVPANSIAEWDGSQWLGWSGGVSGGPSPVVNDIKVQGGTVYVAGSFRSAGGLNITNLATWNGTTWGALGGGPYGTNYGLAFIGQNLYTCGNFTNIAGSSMLNVAQWNGFSWQALAPGTNGQVSSSVGKISSGNGILYAAGNFVRAGAAGVAGVAKWDGNAWTALIGPKTHGTGLTAFSIRGVGTDLYAGGSFSQAGGTTAAHIGRFDGTNWNVLESGVNGNALAEIEFNGQIFVGGSFTIAGNVPVKNVAMWDGTWHALGVGLNNTVRAFAVYNGDLYAGGSFTSDGTSVPFLFQMARWDGSAWQYVPNVNAAIITGQVNTLVTNGGYLYAGGSFTWYADVDTFTNIARFDGSVWTNLGTGLGPGVSALAFYNNELYAGGTFTNSGGAQMKRISKWNGSSWVTVGSGFDSGGVSAMGVTPLGLYVGGSFTNSGATALNYVAKWDGLSWSPLGSGVFRTPGNPSVSGIYASGNDVYFVGPFTYAGGKPSSNIGRWNETLNFGPPPAIRLVNTRLLPGHQFSFDISGLSSGTYTIDASTNLTNWTAIATNNASTTTNFTDPASGTMPRRTYRVHSP